MTATLLFNHYLQQVVISHKSLYMITFVCDVTFAMLCIWRCPSNSCLWFLQRPDDTTLVRIARQISHLWSFVILQVSQGAVRPCYRF